jgi:hypothetical protein
VPSKCVPLLVLWSTRTKYVPGGRTPTENVYGPHGVNAMVHIGLRSDELIVIVGPTLTLKGGFGVQPSLQTPEIWIKTGVG